jgi:ribosomal-protein-alanine N-acetyltransferase
VTAATEVRIVPMRAGHIDQLMRYERDLFGAEAWTRSSYRAELTDTRTRGYVVAEDPGGRLLGWAGVRVVADEADIMTVGVIATVRRRGIAARLLGELLEIARARGAKFAYLEVRIDNDAARKLYSREGFAELGVRRGYYDGGRVDGVVMQREL